MNNNTLANILSKEVVTYSHGTDLVQSKPQPKGKLQAKNTSQKPPSGARESPKQNVNDRSEPATEEDERRKRKFTLIMNIIFILCQ